jgi:hypothetical protein
MMRGGRLVVALEDPTQPQGARRDRVRRAAARWCPVLARSGTLGAIDRAYEKLGIGAWLPATAPARPEPAAGVRTPATPGKLLATLEQGRQPRPEVDDDAVIEQSDNSLVRLINTMILEAQAQGVSDIHIECAPGREKVRIRFRKDGQLRPYLELPHTYRSALMARIKIMCDLDISERRKPQDGKINFGKFVQGSKLELRVATIPTTTTWKTRCCACWLGASRCRWTAGPEPAQPGTLQAPMQRPYGMVLCVGPTGSGKTTTLHSALGYINTPERKIWTAEDPVEITQPGLRQVQVNPRIDWTFAKALRAFLRADPDVIMVGEIRDKETAHRHRGLADRPPGAEHAAHQQRRRNRDAPARHGHGPVQLRRLRCWPCWRSAWCAAVPSCVTSRPRAPTRSTNCWPTT